MTFDLYGTTAPAPERLTTLEALAAADWTGPDMAGVWHLMWDDHTDYPDPPSGGVFTCELYETSTGWTFEFQHSERAGGDEFDILPRDAEMPIEEAMAECKEFLASRMEQWAQGMEVSS